jgi:hypothetical protein
VAQRLSEVFVVPGDPPGAGRVEEPAHAHQGVDDEAAPVLQGLHRLELQEVVDDPHRQHEVREEVVDGELHASRQHEVPADGHWLQQPGVERIVEGPDAAVHRLQGVPHEFLIASLLGDRLPGQRVQRSFRVAFRLRGAQHEDRRQRGDDARAEKRRDGTPRVHQSASMPESWTKRPIKRSIDSALSV